MKNLPAALTALLQTGRFNTADLYTFILADGTKLRFTTADVDLTAWTKNFSTGLPERQLFKSGPTLFERSQITWKLGLEVDSVDVQAFPHSSDLVGGLPFVQACEQGLFDGAELQIERGYMPMRDFFDTSAGSVVLWCGRLGDLDGFGRTSVPMQANSHLELLNIQMPRNTYRPACAHTLYDAGCGLTKADWDVTGTVGEGATVSSVPVAGTGQADGYFDLGLIVCNGETRTIKKWADDTATVIVPFRSLPAGEVTLYPGCNKRMDTCEDTFDNLANFRGFPFVPMPEMGI